MRKGWLGSAGFALLAVVAVAGTPLRALVLPMAKYAGPKLPPSTLEVPHQRTLAWQNESALATSVYQSWAEKPLCDFAKRGQGDAARILLGRLLTRRHLAETNEYILAAKPWGVAGTSGWQNPRGDYDFAEAVLTTVLWRFGEDPATLTPAARDHLLNVLLIEDGNDFRTTAPHTLGLVEETENHLLMTEGSRYLKNRWLRNHGNLAPRYDNATNGMEDRLLALLAAIRTTGFHEFNSQPYIGYTILGLLNLEAFASERLRASARDLLDTMNWNYALGSYRLRHFPPFRRRDEYAAMTSLTAGYQTAYMTAWLSHAPTPLELPKLQPGGETHAIIGACLPYRPPDAVVRLLFDKGAGYFTRIGHGRDASPEIDAAGPGFLLSAGGVNRGGAAMIVARPITLLLDDSGTELDRVIHLAGPGNDFKQWNNTGVAANFACAAGPVRVPEQMTAAQENGSWRIYPASHQLVIAVYSKPQVGLVAVFRNVAPAELLRALTAANPDEAALAREFVFPGGRKLTYDLNSPRNQWVMISDSGKILDREFDRWPLLDGSNRSFQPIDP